MGLHQQDDETMSDTFYIGQNDTAQDYVKTLSNSAGAVDLTGATVQLRLRNPATGAVTVGACTLTDATNGVVTYEWQPSDTAIAGQFDAKFVVTFPSAQIGTYPNNTTDIVLIGAEIPAA